MSERVMILSRILQLIGLLIVVGSNLRFFCKAHKEYGSLKKAFVAMTRIQVAMNDEELQKADADEVIKKFYIANLLYTNYRDSMIGVLFTLAGVILGAVVIFN